MHPQGSCVLIPHPVLIPLSFSSLSFISLFPCLYPSSPCVPALHILVNLPIPLFFYPSYPYSPVILSFISRLPCVSSHNIFPFLCFYPSYLSYPVFLFFISLFPCDSILHILILCVPIHYIFTPLFLVVSFPSFPSYSPLPFVISLYSFPFSSPLHPHPLIPSLLFLPLNSFVLTPFTPPPLSSLYHPSISFPSLSLHSSTPYPPSLTSTAPLSLPILPPPLLFFL